MDELKRMGRILAEKAMEWRLSEREDGTWYVDKDDNPLTRCILWAPWDSWGQCGRVIEAMRERGWPAFSARRCVDVGWYASFGKYFKTRDSDDLWRADGPEVYADTFPKAASLAACRALESEAADEQG